MQTSTSVERVMTRDVVTVVEEQNLAQVRATMRGRAFRHLPVVDGSKVVGILSQRDIQRATVTGLDESVVARGKELRFLEQTFVRDVMKIHVVCLHPNDTLKLAAQQMLEHQVGALPVTDEDGNLLGIVSGSDLIRLIASGE